MHAQRLFLIALLASWSGRTLAQPAVPKPSREQQKLQALVGHWKYEGSVKETALSGAAHWTGPDHTFELFPGGLFVVHRWEKDKNDRGDLESGIEIMAYDTTTHMYVAHSYTSLGDVDVFHFVWVGDTLKFTDDTLRYKGRKGLERCAVVVARTTQTLDCRVSLDGKGWVPESHGVWTRLP